MLGGRCPEIRGTVPGVLADEKQTRLPERPQRGSPSPLIAPDQSVSAVRCPISRGSSSRPAFSSSGSGEGGGFRGKASTTAEQRGNGGCNDRRKDRSTLQRSACLLPALQTGERGGRRRDGAVTAGRGGGAVCNMGGSELNLRIIPGLSHPPTTCSHKYPTSALVTSHILQYMASDVMYTPKLMHDVRCSQNCSSNAPQTPVTSYTFFERYMSQIRHHNMGVVGGHILPFSMRLYKKQELQSVLYSRGALTGVPVYIH